MGKNPFDFDYLAKKLDEMITVKDNKKISFNDAFLVNDLVSILESAYDFEISIPDSQKQFIINEGIKKFAFMTKRNGKQLKTQIRKSEKEFLQKPFQKYSVLSSFSFPYFNKLSNIKLLDGTVTFYHNSYPSKYNLSKIYQDFKSHSESIPPHGYVPIKVDVNARNNQEAIDKGLGLSDLLRGIWNYSINNKESARIYYGIKKPINIIRLGPTHTLHLSNGKLANENFWYELNYVEASSTWEVENKWTQISEEFSWIRKAIIKLPYKKEFYDVFIRYAKALDASDYETSYLKLWSLLEYLTGTLKNFSNYDKTISRALFFYNDDKLSKQIIEHLRRFRNKIVHYGKSKDEMDPILFQIKRIVETIMWFHLKFTGKFKSLEEFGNFLDITKNKDTIAQEIKLRKQALKFLYK